jgi:hypothetical protein
MMQRRKFKRPLGERRYRKLFVIAAEGAKTEPQYFAIFNNQRSIIRVNCLKGKTDSAPSQVLRRMAAHLKKEALRESDEAWLVVDKDQWTDEQLSKLHEWAQTKANFGLSLSNPKFEYWLLLHFEDGTGIDSPQDCVEHLRRYLPDYDKGIDSKKFPPESVAEAIRRARHRDNPPCPDWPRTMGSTTVYRLVENIMA